ncbi:MAG: hypothetical protein WC326_16085 [Candidatus Delongbacteria bacterium]
MRILPLFCLLLLLAGCEESSLPDRTWTATLTVRVVDSNTGQALPGALVFFANDSIELNPPYNTGAAGRASYEIEIFNGNSVRLDAWRVSKSGYLTWNRNAAHPTGATLDEDDSSAEVEVELIALP